MSLIIRKNNITKMKISLLCIIVVLYIIYTLYRLYISPSKNDIAKLTDQWIHEVTVNNDPDRLFKLFCKDGNLVGTVSKEKREKIDIKKYFDYFAKLPNIEVISSNYNISKVTDNVYINTAFVTWKWDGLDEPIVARMTFVYRNNCIFQLHSSALPDLNEDLYKISGSQ